MRAFLVLIALGLALGVTSQAHATSIAYIDNGEVWLSSLDGAQKVRLAGHVVNPSGVTEKWLDIAHADNGRIVAVRNVPGRMSSFNWFKAWEPDGTSTIEGPQNSVPGWTTTIHPLSFDLTADGKHMVYGYSNSNYGYPLSTYQRGTYVRSVSSSSLDPIPLVDMENPTIVGDRVIARKGSDVYVQRPGTPYGADFDPWATTAGLGFDLRRTDVAANQQLLAFEAEQWTGGTQTMGKIGVLSIQSIDAFPDAPAINCFMPASGVAEEATVSLDARFVGWTDEQGLKVAGGPTGTDDYCGLTTPAVVISPTGSHGAIGGANVATFLPPAPPPPGPATGTPPPAGGGSAAAPVPNVPAKLKLAATGTGLKVAVAAAGKVTVTATVPAKAMGKKGKPVTIGTGSTTAKGAGTVTVKLKLTAAAKKRLKKLKGAKLTLRFVHNGRTTTKTVKVA